ncbi:hypothetical protein [Aurantimonas coralicida]|uniref:hypothetical protein n=1 Tax=Aurantimonas coralicida TaxID=182270 RepID=UPI001D1973B4|nr:hypothetical protein [Aurantimonas coralicida]MCC4296790.1 hypothetical protein [Aurantimonas coralicida]
MSGGFPDHLQAGFAIIPPVILTFESEAFEDPNGVVEIDPMLFEIDGVFGGIPLEVHLAPIILQNVLRFKIGDQWTLVTRYRLAAVRAAWS